MINAIVAVSSNQGIGLKGSMPWPHLSKDLQWFKRITANSVVIMGSVTWNSLPKKPLDQRINVVISQFKVKGADYCFRIPEAALVFAKDSFPEREIFIIGGQSLYNSTLDIVDKFYVTEIDKHFECDRFFNLGYVKEKFQKIIVHEHHTEPISFTMKEYTKI